MLLIAVKPTGKVIPCSFIYADGVDDESIAFPVSYPLAIKRRVRIFAMRVAIRGLLHENCYSIRSIAPKSRVLESTVTDKGWL